MTPVCVCASVSVNMESRQNKQNKMMTMFGELKLESRLQCDSQLLGMNFVFNHNFHFH